MGRCASRATSTLDSSVPCRNARMMSTTFSVTDRRCAALPDMRGSMDLGLGHRCARLEEVEVAALVGLGDVFQVQRAVAPLVLRRRRLPSGPALGQLLVGHLEV